MTTEMRFKAMIEWVWRVTGSYHGGCFRLKFGGSEWAKLEVYMNGVDLRTTHWMGCVIPAETTSSSSNIVEGMFPIKGMWCMSTLHMSSWRSGSTQGEPVMSRMMGHWVCVERNQSWMHTVAYCLQIIIAWNERWLNIEFSMDSGVEDVK